MAFFLRKEEPRYSDYKRYKPHLQRDFRRQCAYCERTEGYVRAPEFFGVDHFRPKALFPALDCEYSNLYYCCNRCNGIKSDKWPSEADFADGRRFADPCESDPYVDHFVETADGFLNSLTETGNYTIAYLRLNDPPCRDFRIKRSRAATKIARLRELIQAFSSPEVPPILWELLADVESEWSECFHPESSNST